MAAKPKRSSMESLPGLTLPEESEFELKAVFSKVHSKLRDQGLNPIEALAVVSAVISGESHDAIVDSQDLLALRAASPKAFAAAFQTFLTDDLRTAFGQYLTPAPVADHVADLVSAAIPKKGRVLDPFGGSGILLESLHDTRPDLKYVSIEINPSAARVARAISTSEGMNLEVRVADAFEEWNTGNIETFDAVVMNPPFGSKLVTLTLQDLRKVLNFDVKALGANPPVEIISLILATSVVKHGGLVAAVLPQSVLTNRSFSSFRKKFFELNELVHVTSLPESTFGPFKGVAKACVCLIRVGQTKIYPYEFSVRVSKNIGYDSNGRKTKLNDLLKPISITSGTVFDDGVIQLSNLARNRKTISFRLGDFAEVFRGRNPKDEDYIDGNEGAYLLKVGSLSGTMLSWAKRKRSIVNKDFFGKSGDRALRVGDICLTAAAHKPRYIGLKVDLVSSIPEGGAVPSAELLVIRSRDHKKLPPESLLYFLRSSEGYEQIQAMVRGSTAHLYPNDLMELEVVIDSDPIKVEKIRKAFWDASKAHHKSLELQAKAYEEAGLEPFQSPIEDE